MDAIQYKCPNCNADLKFNPETQKLSCEYCLSSFSMEDILIGTETDKTNIPEINEVKEASEEEKLYREFEEHTNLYHCSSCGADIMADDQQTALFCYYCHNPVILSGKLTGSFKPGKVIGFKLTKDTAVQKFRTWIGERWFVPSDFKSEQQLEKITGLYVPFWIADCDLTADYCALGKKVRSWTSGNYRYTETKEFRIVRRANIFTDGIPADGESKIDDLLMESIEPFDYKEIKDFSMSYLSGFYADKYDVDKAEVFPRIRIRATEASKRLINSSVSGYTTVVPSIENYNIINTKWQYMLLPVWFMTYKYKDKMYEFAINGQTGKLAGTPPLDKGKLKRFCASVGALAASALFLLGGVIF